MFKLIKYELRGNFLTILATCITVIIGNLLLMTMKNYWGINAVSAFSMCLTIGSIIVIFISSLKIMSKYLYGDSGYLLFTLPQSGKSIVTSRLITALVQISIVAFVSIFMCYLTVTYKVDFSFFKDLRVITVLYSIIGYIFNILSFLIFIYFCMIIGKVALKSRKLGKIGSFIIFIIILVGLAWLLTKTTNLFPQTLNLSDLSITTNKVSISDFTRSGTTYINIANAIFNIIIFIVFFLSSSYLIDRKLDLS